MHWPTSLRTGDLVVLDRHRSADTRWIVRVDPDAGDSEEQAGRARWALDEGRRRGVRTAAAVGAEVPVEIADTDAVARWTATCIPDHTATWPRQIACVRPEEGLPLAPTAWWAVAAATFTSLTLLVGAIGSSAVTIALLAAGTAVGAAVTAWVGRSGGELPTFVRALVAVAALAGVAFIAADAGSTSGLLAVLRGPLPQFLMLLVVLHGFECTDRRTGRVSLAISAVVASYAAGLRVDGQLGWWLAAWGTCFLTAILLTAHDDRQVIASLRSVAAVRAVRPSAGRVTHSVFGLAAGVLATVLLLSLVPRRRDPRRLPSPPSSTRPASSPHPASSLAPTARSPSGAIPATEPAAR